MEISTNNNPLQMIQATGSITTIPSSNFIEANTKYVELDHLKKDCIIPVFSKDNESTISHAQFIDETYKTIQEYYPNQLVAQPQIRVSHVIKGRIPSSIGKPVKELLDHEKTIYYERCAFMIEVPSIKENVNGNLLTLSIGGVRAYNQENLYSKKSLEKFKVFIGFKNLVCTNLCISTDGFSNDIRIGSIGDLKIHIHNLISNYNAEKHLGMMEKMSKYSLTEQQFAHLIGKFRMHQFLDKSKQKLLPPITLNDSQINTVVKGYYSCPNFSKETDNSINVWNLYNLFTEANKSSYIDSNLERNVNAYELINALGNYIENRTNNWLLTY